MEDAQLYELHDEDVSPEALLIAALMRTRDMRRVENIARKLTAADFYNTSCAAIFATMRDQIAQGRPCDAASIRSALRAQGEQSGIQPADVDPLITTLIGLNAADFLLESYVSEVASLSYRRQFMRMADRLAQIAATAPEDDLYDLLIKEGKAQRKTWERYRELHAQPQEKDGAGRHAPQAYGAGRL